MKEYSKPVIDVVSEAAEGVYAASGKGKKPDFCQSIYMTEGKQDLTNDGYTGGTMKSHFGCTGCLGYTGGICGLEGHYKENGMPASYQSNFDQGRYKPAWEYNGKQPGDPVVGDDFWYHAEQR